MVSFSGQLCNTAMPFFTINFQGFRISCTAMLSALKVSGSVFPDAPADAPTSIITTVAAVNVFVKGVVMF